MSVSIDALSELNKWITQNPRHRILLTDDEECSQNKFIRIFPVDEKNNVLLSDKKSTVFYLPIPVTDKK